MREKVTKYRLKLPQKLTALFILFIFFGFYNGDKDIKEYRGVVTAQLLSAKVLQINNLDENPEPGKSYIGNEKIIVEVEENPEVQANWSIVKIKYYKYDKPKVIKYEAFSEQMKITVNYHAVEVVLDGNLSKYLIK